jgi:AraC-like DNA-binding protein
MKERLAGYPHFRADSLEAIRAWSARRIGPQTRRATAAAGIDYRVNLCRWDDVTLAWVGISIPMEIEIDACMPGYLVQLPVDGAQYFVIGGTRYVADRDNAVIISPTSPSPIVHRAGPGSRFVLQLGTRIVRATLRDLGLLEPRANLPALPVTLDLTRGPGRILRTLLASLVAELERPDTRLTRHEYTLEHVSRGIVGLMFRSDAARSSRDTMRLGKVTRFVDEHLDQPLTLSDLAKAGGLSRRTLQRAFSRRFEMAPLEYVRRQRLERARELLLTGGPGTTVTNVAGRSGFAHMGRFAREYRAHFGERPSATLARASELAGTGRGA